MYTTIYSSRRRLPVKFRRGGYRSLGFFTLTALYTLLAVGKCQAPYEVDCSTLRMGQYLCPDPEYDVIDPKTQQPRGCTKENKAKVVCRAADNIICKETNSSTFKREIPCKWTNGYSFETALLLSIFVGMLGADRFYLGYPGIGLLKLSTLGFMFLGQLIDVVLIATQVVRPADGSYYVIPYYGPVIDILSSDNETYRLPQPDW